MRRHPQFFFLYTTWDSECLKHRQLFSAEPGLRVGQICCSRSPIGWMTECKRNKRLAGWDLQFWQRTLEVGLEPRRRISECCVASLLGDWPFPPNGNRQALSTRPISGKTPALFSFPQRTLSATDLFNCKEMFGSTSGPLCRGGIVCVCIYIYSPFSYPLSLCFSVSTQNKLFSQCLIQQKAWKCSALFQRFSVKEEEGETEKEKRREGTGAEWRGLLVIKPSFCG